MADKGGFTEVGRSGLRQWSGYIAEEFLRELTGVRGMAMYREMLMNDAIVGALMYAIETLLKGVEWHVDAAEDSGPQGEDRAEFVQSCLDDLNLSWQDTLAEILSMLPYGFSLMEVVYKRRQGPAADPMSRFTDGRIGWRKWAIRSQETIERWEFDEMGGIRDFGEGIGPASSGRDVRAM